MSIKGVDNLVWEEDITLFSNIKKGNNKAIEKLYNKYYHSLCRFGALYESNNHIVEENVNDVFMYLWDNKQKLNEIKKPKSYLYVILKNKLKKTSKDYQVKSLDQYEQFDSCTSELNVEEHIIANEQSRINKVIISNILKKIPSRTRQVFEMSRLDGFKYKEISELLDITPKTVENHIGIALKYISKELANIK
ncbi:sigma-70 family RNA polymerase sigma factor [Ochrovirga pacifica]|uniref:sigma-70 family RNA polymerase sigma factor n=1 Tax=Ochrovirga pacifica TaxID=1042376 RepID=UPI0002558B33|nr:sigma-70 family RNA polymerase sigma factor [Ochrovirga pacifica]